MIDFNLEKWKTLQQAPDTTAPYFAAADVGEKARLFVSATAFPDWKSWSAQARAAISSLFIRDTDSFVALSKTPPLADKPFYIRRKTRFSYDEIWLNALCLYEGETAFLRALRCAEQDALAESMGCRTEDEMSVDRLFKSVGGEPKAVDIDALYRDV